MTGPTRGPEVALRSHGRPVVETSGCATRGFAVLIGQPTNPPEPLAPAFSPVPHGQPGGRSACVSCRQGSSRVGEGPELERAEGSDGVLRGHLHSLVETSALEDVEAADLNIRIRDWAGLP